MKESTHPEEKKGFWSRWLEKLDKKLETEAQKPGRCCDSKKNKPGRDSCCG